MTYHSFSIVPIDGGVKIVGSRTVRHSREAIVLPKSDMMGALTEDTVR